MWTRTAAPREHFTLRRLAPVGGLVHGFLLEERPDFLRVGPATSRLRENRRPRPAPGAGLEGIAMKNRKAVRVLAAMLVSGGGRGARRAG